MPRFCAVVGCSNRSNRETQKKYFSFPGIRDRRGNDLPEGIRKRQLWISALHREDFPDSKIRHARICSDHFLSGYPSDDPLSPDYVPHINMGYNKSENAAIKRARYDRARKRKLLVASTSTTSSFSPADSQISEEDMFLPRNVDISESQDETKEQYDQITQTDNSQKNLEYTHFK